MIRVAVEDAQVKLTGIVGSAAEKRRARGDAWVNGVDSVDDSGLKIERWARDEDLRKNKYASRSDSDVRDAVEDAFIYDPRVFSFNITPQVTAGHVTLRGIVDNAKAKQAAERVARHTVGVYSVSNHLKIRSGDDLTDKQIRIV